RERDQICRSQITYFKAGGSVATMVRERRCMSAPEPGSWVKSRAQTTFCAFGLWSEGLLAWAASPIEPSEAVERPGATALISALSTSRLRATLQPDIHPYYRIKRSKL